MAAQAEEQDWPREITVPEGTITVYQPQPESFEGNLLTARAAVSVLREGETDPIFGAVWFDARVSVDRTDRTVVLADLTVPKATFPGADPDKLKKFGDLVKSRLAERDQPISLDRLLTSLDLVEKEQAGSGEMKSTPPAIRFVTHPVVLVPLDGEPVLQQMEGTKVMRVANTAFFIALDPESSVYYLKGAGVWLTAKDVMGPWESAGEVPGPVKVAAAVDPGAPADVPSPDGVDRMPEIMMATEPTEVILTDGKPSYAPVHGTGLLCMNNTESDVFMVIESQEHFVLLSGRWFKSKTLEGPWTNVPSDSLPEDFSEIPSGSSKAHVLASVAGTDEAREAVLDTYVPQTASIDRSQTTLEVSYDGDAQFEEVEGTGMDYAVNTAYPVIEIDGRYYCCHDGVWYVADDPLGPWVVCVEVPEEIYTIPPSCPVYYVRYVRVYDYTPDVVYVGYTPGYVGCYVHRGVVVYGTGHVYRPWYRERYIARPCTWGFAARYNHRTGNWGVRVGHHGPEGWVATAKRGTGWWGPGGCHGFDVDIHNNIRIDRSRDIYNRRGDLARAGTHKGAVGTGGTAGGERKDRKPGAVAGAPRKPRAEAKPRPADGARKKNNVYTDREGHVYRRTEKGWEKRDRSGWSSQRIKKPTSKPDHGQRKPSSSKRASGYSRKGSGLDRAHHSRQRGASRTHSFRGRGRR